MEIKQSIVPPVFLLEIFQERLHCLLIETNDLRNLSQVHIQALDTKCNLDPVSLGELNKHSIIAIRFFLIYLPSGVHHFRLFYFITV